MSESSAILEAILYASGEAVDIQRLCAIMKCSDETLLEVADELHDVLEQQNRGIRLIILSDSLQLCTAPLAADFVSVVLETKKPGKISASAMETLAVIAWYQPTTKIFVDRIRGVDSSYSVSSLCRRGLIEECGRSDAPGRPILYKTTNDFLRVFGIRSIDDLPSAESLQLISVPPVGESEAKNEIPDSNWDPHPDSSTAGWSDDAAGR